jgi:Na+/melibiose symporter-like transporter
MKSDDALSHLLKTEDERGQKDEIKRKIKIKGDDLTQMNILAYGMGHILNDLTATCWFSFLLYYLTDIVNISKKKAGWVMLSGQIFDGIATPLVGIFSDKIKTRWGKRTPWYLGGTLGVIVCFSLIFQKCEMCRNSSNPDLYELMYYITLPSLFNIAWASVQVSHMALLPSISINKKNRDYMVRLRTAFTFSSQMVCLLLSFVIFYYVHDKYLQYSVLSIACVIIGTITSIFFLFNCPEVQLSENISKYYENMKNILLLRSKQSKENYNTIESETADLQMQFEEKNQKLNSYGVMYWLSKASFYKYIVIYMLVRLSINVTSSMLPYYLEYILGFKKTETGGTPVQISLIYILSTFGCLFNSLIMQKYIEKLNSRVWMMFFAWIFSTLGLFPVIFLHSKLTLPMYFLSFFFGMGFALALSASSSLINDVVGSKGDHGAFVYGAYSLTDKFCSGILLFIFVDYVKDDLFLLKYVVPILPIVSIFFAFIIVSFRKKKPENETEKIFILSQENSENQNNSQSIIDSSKFSFVSAS